MVSPPSKQFIKSFLYMVGHDSTHTQKYIFSFFFVLVDMGTPVIQTIVKYIFSFTRMKKKSIKTFSDGGGRSDRYT
jgi:hypothetical protein